MCNLVTFFLLSCSTKFDNHSKFLSFVQIDRQFLFQTRKGEILKLDKKFASASRISRSLTFSSERFCPNSNNFHFHMETQQHIHESLDHMKLMSSASLLSMEPKCTARKIRNIFYRKSKLDRSFVRGNQFLVPIAEST